MKIKDLKIATLKICELPQDEDFSNLEQLENNSIYEEYLKVFYPALNRALSRIVSAKAVGYKQLEIDNATPTTKEFRATKQYDLAQISTRIYEVEGVEKLDINGRISPINYYVNGNILIVDKIPMEMGYKYLVTYSVRLPLITELSTSGDGEEGDEFELNTLEIPEEIQSIIPYYIKGDIYEETNVAKANNARQMFELYMSQFENHQYENVQTEVIRTWEE